MQKGAYVYVILLLSFGWPTSVKADVPRPFNVNRLVELIDQQQLKTIEEVIENLPEDLRRNVTYVFESRSIQDADEQNPRAILWDPSGKFSLTFNGLARHDGYRTLEMFQFDDSESRFHFYKMEFPLTVGPSGRTRAHVTEPQVCLGCHGKDPRPIWREYPNWEGVYGTVNDFPVADLNPLQKFSAMAVFHPRYKHLIPKNPTANYPYRFENADNQLSMSNAAKHRPNLRIGNLMSRLNAKRIVRKLENSKRFQNDPLFVIRNFMGCSLDTTDTESHKDFRQFVESLGLRMADLDLRFFWFRSSNDALKFSDSYFDGTATTNEYVSSALLERLLKFHPKLKENYRPRFLKTRLGHRLDPFSEIDQEFYLSADRNGGWIPIPFPSEFEKSKDRPPLYDEEVEDYMRTCEALQKVKAD